MATSVFGNDFNSAMAALLSAENARNNRSEAIRAGLRQNAARWMDTADRRSDRDFEGQQNAFSRALAEQELNANTELGRERNRLLGKQIDSEMEQRRQEIERTKINRDNAFGILSATAAQLKRAKATTDTKISQLETKIEADAARLERTNAALATAKATGSKATPEDIKALQDEAKRLAAQIRTNTSAAAKLRDDYDRSLNSISQQATANGFVFDPENFTISDTLGISGRNQPTAAPAGTDSPRAAQAAQAGGSTQTPWAASQFSEEDALYASPNASNPMAMSGDLQGPPRDTRSLARKFLSDISLPQSVADTARVAGGAAALPVRQLGRLLWNQQIEPASPETLDAVGRTINRMDALGQSMADYAQRSRDERARNPYPTWPWSQRQPDFNPNPPVSPFGMRFGDEPTVSRQTMPANWFEAGAAPEVMPATPQALDRGSMVQPMVSPWAWTGAPASPQEANWFIADRFNFDPRDAGPTIVAPSPFGSVPMYREPDIYNRPDRLPALPLWIR